MSLPVGFRFHPSDEELIVHYLKHKLNGQDELVDDTIGEIDVYRRDPWDLPDFARKESDDLVWYFFCRLEFLYGNTARANRKTENGFWKITGKSRDIKAKESGRVIGTKKTVVFHFKFGDSSSSKPVRTDWVIHEYQPYQPKPHINQQNPIVLCKLKQKSDEASVPIASVRKFPAAFSPGTAVLQSIIPRDNMEFNHPTMLTDVDVDVDVDLAEFDDSFFADPNFIPSMWSPNMHSGGTSTNQLRQVQSTQHDDILLMRAISEDSDASRHNRIEHESSISEELPKIAQFLLCQKQSPQVAPHIKKEYPSTDRPRASSSAAVPKDERKITVAPIRKPKAPEKKEPLGPVLSTSDDRGCAFIRKETIMASHSPTLTSVHLRNVIVGLFLLIFFVFQLLLLH